MKYPDLKTKKTLVIIVLTLILLTIISIVYLINNDNKDVNIEPTTTPRLKVSDQEYQEWEELHSTVRCYKSLNKTQDEFEELIQFMNSEYDMYTYDDSELGIQVDLVGREFVEYSTKNTYKSSENLIEEQIDVRNKVVDGEIFSTRYAYSFDSQIEASNLDTYFNGLTNIIQFYNNDSSNELSDWIKNDFTRMKNEKSDSILVSENTNDKIKVVLTYQRDDVLEMYKVIVEHSSCGNQIYGFILF